METYVKPWMRYCVMVERVMTLRQPNKSGAMAVAFFCSIDTEHEHRNWCHEEALWSDDAHAEIALELVAFEVDQESRSCELDQLEAWALSPAYRPQAVKGR